MYLGTLNSLSILYIMCSIFHVFNIYKLWIGQCLPVVYVLEGSFELLLSCFAAKGINGSDITSFLDLWQDVVGFTVTIFWHVLLVNVDILKLRFPSVFVLLAVGVRTNGLSTLASSCAGSISYCGLNCDSLNSIAALVVLLAFENPFLCFSVCLLFLTKWCLYSYSFKHLVYLFEVTGCLHAWCAYSLLRKLSRRFLAFSSSFLNCRQLFPWPSDNLWNEVQ